MKKLKIVLSADWHLDSPWEMLSPEKAAQMRRLQREMPHRISRIAREERADLILLAGDLFDSATPYAESVRAVEQAFDGIGIPVFIAPGNHDPLPVWKGIKLPENVHLFTGEGLECVSTPCAEVYGAAFTRGSKESIELSAPVCGEKPRILLLHGDVGGRGEYLPISEKQLAESGFHFAALGHIHKPSGLKRSSNTWWCYPGCPMGRGFDETGARGIMLITLDGHSCEGEFLELSDRRFEVISVPVTDKDPFEALEEAVFSAREGDICRFELTGRAENVPSVRALETLALKKGLYAAFLSDRTMPPVNTGDNSLRASLIALARERASAGQDVAEALKWALAALDGGEAPRETAQ